MPDKCIAPECTTPRENKSLPKGQKISQFYFPNQDLFPEIRKRWISAVPRVGFTPSKNSVLCEKHFIPSDFRTTSKDTNSTRAKQREKVITVKALKDNAVPSKWPGCPDHLSKTPDTPRTTSLASAAAREERESVRDEIRASISFRIAEQQNAEVEERESVMAEEAVERETFATIDELVNKLELPDNFQRVLEGNCLVIFSFQKVEIPSLEVVLKVFPSLHYKVWYKSSEITKTEAEECLLPPKLRTLSELRGVLATAEARGAQIDSYKSKPTAVKVSSDEEIIAEIVDKLTTTFPDNVKVGFLAEQLSFAIKKPNGRRYSPDILAQCSEVQPSR